MEECYPYYVGIKWLYYKGLGQDTSTLLMKRSRWHNKNNYNFWKAFLVNKNPDLANIVFQAEAFVRFMSGSFWALTFGLVPGAVLLFYGPDSPVQFVVGSVLTLTNLLLVQVILSCFKNQRRREVKLLLDAILTLYLNGLHPMNGQRANVKSLAGIMMLKP